MRPGKVPEILSHAFSEWLQDEASLLAAALAYFGLFSFVPLLIIVLITINSLYHHGLLGGDVAQQAQELAGRQVPVAAEELIGQVVEQAASFRLTLASAALLILGAAGLFVQTKRAFRIIWRLPEEEAPLTGTVVSYLRSFLLIALVAFLLLTTSVFTALLQPLGRQVEESLPVHLGLLRLLTFLISLALVTVLFAVTYKTLIKVELCWGEVLPGAALAALLFAAGNFVIEAYVGIVNFGSAYGAAGSLVVFLLWVYYSAQIFLFGAELIKVLRSQRSMPGAVNG